MGVHDVVVGYCVFSVFIPLYALIDGTTWVRRKSGLSTT
jgi:hypothetical protein